MPNYKKSNSKRKSYKKKPRKKAYVPSVPGTLSTYGTTGVVSRLARKLRYASDFVGGNAGAVPGSHIFNLNSLYDPDLTLAGHQPRCFDQYATLYHKYVVNAVKIKLYGTPNSQTVPSVVAIGFVAHNATPAGFGIVDILEDGRFKCKCFTAESREMCIMKRYSKIATIESKTSKGIYEEPQYAALVTTSPTFVPKAYIYWSPLDATTIINFNMRVVIDYYCEFFEPKNPAAS